MYKSYLLLVFSLMTSILFAQLQMEIEPNETFFEATPIDFGEQVEGFINESRDDDNYLISVTEPGVIVINVLFMPSNLSLDAFIHNPNFVEIRGTNSSITDEAYTLSVSVCEVGDYYLYIRNGGLGGNQGNGFNSNTPYLFRANFVPFSTTDINECEDGSNNNNGSIQQASPIMLNNTVNATISSTFFFPAGSSSSTQDVDFYAIDFDEPGIFNFRLLNIPNNLELDAFFYKPDQTIITEVTSAIDNEAYERELSICEIGTYYLQIRDGSLGGNAGSDFNNTIQYQLSLQFTPFSEVDEQECDNNFEFAFPITTCDTIESLISPPFTRNPTRSDVDYRVISLFANETVNFRFTSVPGNIELEVELFDRNEVSLDMYDGNSGADVIFDFTPTETADYYLKVSDDGTNFSSTNTYMLFVSCTGNELIEICDNGEDDDGDGLIDCDDPDCSESSTNDCPSCEGSVSFADVLIEYTPGCSTIDTEPTGAIGINDWNSSDQLEDAAEAVFLGEGGSIELGFTNNILTNSGDSDPDLWIFEVGPAVEASSIALRPADTFTTNQLGNLMTVAGGYFVFGEIEGATSSLDIDAIISNYDSGTLRFDAVKITDISDGDCSGLTPGADIDAICALSSVVPDDCDTSTLAATVTTTDVICDTDTLGIIEVNASGGIEPYMYQLSDNPTEPDNIYTGVPANFADSTYRITVIDAVGCEFEVTGIVIEDGCDEEEDIRLIVGEVSGASGDIVKIPVILEGCNNIRTLQATIGFSNPDILEVNSFEDAAINLFGSNTASPPRFTFSDSSGEGTAIMDGDTLFYVVVTLTGNPGEESVVELNNDFLFVELVCAEGDESSPANPTLINGLVQIVENFSVSGQILTYQGAGINNVMVEMGIVSNGNLVANSVVSTQTDINGNYSFENITAGLDWQIKASKNNSSRNGLSSLDIFIMNRNILGFTTPEITSPFQIIAGDANCNEDSDVNSYRDNVTAADFFETNKVLLGLQNNFLGCGLRSWHLIEQSHLITDLESENLFGFESKDLITNVNSDISYNFTGTKIGDVSGNADPSNFNNDNNTDTRSNTIFNLNKQTIIDEELNEVHVHLSLAEAQQLVSCQMELEFDEAALEFVSVEPVGLMQQGGLSHQTENDIRLSWFSPSGRVADLDADDIFVRLKFKLKTNDAPTEQWLTLKTEENYLASLAYNADFEEQRIELLNSTTTTSTTAENAQAFDMKLFPNPATSQVNLSFYMTKQQDARIHVFNVLGQAIYQQEQTTSVGSQTISIPTKNWETGLYYLVLETEQGKHYQNFIVK